MLSLLAETISNSAGNWAWLTGAVTAIVAGILAAIKGIHYRQQRQQRHRQAKTAVPPLAGEKRLCEEHEKRLNALETEAEAKLEALANRFAKLDDKVTRVHERVDELLLKLAFK